MVPSEVMASHLKGFANQVLIFGTPCTTTVLTMVWTLAFSCSVEPGLAKCLDPHCPMAPLSVMPLGKSAMGQTGANGLSTRNVALTIGRRRPAPQLVHLHRQHQVLLQRPALLQPHQVLVQMPSQSRVEI